MNLHFHPISGCARRVLSFAQTQNIPMDLQFVDLRKGEQRSPEYLKLNPTGRVPTLVDGDITLWESGAILQYLARTHKPEALGTTPKEQALASQWLHWGLVHLGASLGTLNAQTALVTMRGGTPNPERVAEARVTLAKDFDLLNSALEGKSYICGDSPTIADFAMAGNLESSLFMAPLELEHEHIKSWYARMLSMPGWPEALTH